MYIISPVFLSLEVLLLWLGPYSQSWISIPSTFSKHGSYTVAHTIDCVCSEMLNHNKTLEILAYLEYDVVIWLFNPIKYQKID